MPYYIPNLSVSPDLSSNPFVTGFEITYVDDYTFTIAQGAARALTTDTIISFSPKSGQFAPTVTVDLRTIGLNGCFPNAINSSTFGKDTVFCVFAVMNPSGTGSTRTGFIVASGTFFLPTGYTAYRRIGLVYVSGADGTIIKMRQYGSGNERYYNLGQPVNVLANDSATTFQTINLTENSPVPPALCTVDLNVAVTNTADGQKTYLSPLNSSDAQTIFAGYGGFNNINYSIKTSLNAAGNAVIGWKTDSGAQNLSLAVVGFTDSLKASLF